VATLAMIAGASGELSPLLSTTVFLFSMLAFVCHPSSPIRRAVERGLHLSVDRPPTPER
jgi:hypothetical protein